MYPRPFENCPLVQVVVPSDFSSLNEQDRQKAGGIKALLEENRNAIVRELGSTMHFTSHPDLCRPLWLIGPKNCNPTMTALGRANTDGPLLFLCREQKLLISDGKDPNEVEETYSYLRSLIQFEGGTWNIRDCQSLDEAIERTRVEIANSFPAFEMKKLNWEEICQRHIPLVKTAVDPIAAMQTWLAELSDAHTWVRPMPALGELPYDLQVVENSGIFYGIFYSVPEGSLAWKHGVRPGCKLMDQDYRPWLQRTAASPHSKPYVVGKRVLSSAPDKKRHLRAQLPGGNIAEWEEFPLVDRWNPVVSWKRLPSKTGYIKIQAWMLAKGVEESIDEAFDAFNKCHSLIVDLRGSPGGSLLMAQGFRNRFLDKDRQIGWIQNTLPDGSLCTKEPLIGHAAEANKRWTKPVIFLTDPLTYSASEDAILGLQGLKNVKVIGKPSGGGSGRMRLIRLLPGYRLTISTALTFDMNGHCVEGNGIPLDLFSDLEGNELVTFAEKLCGAD